MRVEMESMMCVWCTVCTVVFFFFNDTATTEIYTLSLHDALPIWPIPLPPRRNPLVRLLALVPTLLLLGLAAWVVLFLVMAPRLDRKSTRLNSSHANISYAVFCLKKKKQI